jgi:hypothetical protein
MRAIAAIIIVSPSILYYQPFAFSILPESHLNPVLGEAPDFVNFCCDRGRADNSLTPFLLQDYVFLVCVFPGSF